jgi:hypothetical protein
MAALDGFDRVLEQWQLATGAFINGDPEPVQKLFSHEEDVTLANPLGPAADRFGPVARGREQVTKTQEHAASQFSDGEIVGFEIIERYVTPALAYVEQIERSKAKVGGRTSPRSLCGLR